MASPPAVAGGQAPSSVERKRCEDIYARLSAAAGIPAGFLSVEWTETPGASNYSPTRKEIYFGVPLCSSPRQAAFLMAHEMSHALQHADGTWGRVRGVVEDLGAARRYGEALNLHRNIESQADVVAVELMRKAGFSKVEILEGVEEFLGCGAVRRAGGADEENAHSDASGRYANVVFHSARLESGPPPASAGGPPPGPWHAAGVAIEDFDARGRLKALPRSAELALARSCGRGLDAVQAGH